MTIATMGHKGVAWRGKYPRGTRLSVETVSLCVIEHRGSKYIGPMSRRQFAPDLRRGHRKLDRIHSMCHGSFRDIVDRARPADYNELDCAHYVPPLVPRANLR